jgi:hypothetical protein
MREPTCVRARRIRREITAKVSSTPLEGSGDSFSPPAGMEDAKPDKISLCLRHDPAEFTELIVLA